MIDKSRIISIKTREKVLSYLEGQHKAIKTGEEDDLKNIREYTYSDNVKRINWIITAKERKPYVVEREEIKSQNIIMVIFLDQEFLFGKKLERLMEVVGLIGYSTIYQKDKLHTFIFTDRLEKYFKHRNNPEMVFEIVKYIHNIPLKGKKLNIDNFDNYLLNQRKSLVILIGDFFYPINLIRIASKHKLVIVKIRERDEESPEKYLDYQLKSFDDKLKIPYLVKPMIKVYKKNYKKFDERLRQFSVLRRIPIETIYEDEDTFLKLKLLFS